MIKKTKYILAISCWLLAIGYSALAQAPQGINYQAVARDISGNPLATQTVSLEFKIHQTNSSGPVVYDETYSKNTNQFGLFTAVIGQGIVVSGSFTSIAWGTNSYWLEVIVNGFSMAPVTQLMSVPYALFAGNGSSPAGGFSNMQVFNSNGTFTIPSGVNKIMVEVWGGGGGGGAGSAASSGGGGGGYGKGTYTVTPSSNYTVTVGTGGTGGPPSTAGSAGGTSSLGILISATGGFGGTTGSAVNVGAGGNSSISPFNISGGSGFTGCLNCTNFYLLPHGGMAGNGGAGGLGYFNNPGGIGIAPGGGGGGTVGNPNLGGAGAAGRVVVWW